MLRFLRIWHIAKFWLFYQIVCPRHKKPNGSSWILMKRARSTNSMRSERSLAMLAMMRCGKTMKAKRISLPVIGLNGSTGINSKCERGANVSCGCRNSCKLPDPRNVRQTPSPKSEFSGIVFRLMFPHDVGSENNEAPYKAPNRSDSQNNFRYRCYTCWLQQSCSAAFATRAGK